MIKPGWTTHLVICNCICGKQVNPTVSGAEMVVGNISGRLYCCSSCGNRGERPKFRALRLAHKRGRLPTKKRRFGAVR